VNAYGPLAPNSGHGTLAFWQNSSVGQLGPAKAELAILQGFDTNPTLFSSGSHTVTLTWNWSGVAAIILNCYMTGVSGQAVVTEKVELNLFDTTTHRLLLASNAVSTIFSHSITTCNTQSYYTLSGINVVSFPSISTLARNYQVWGYLYTNTTALESSVNDVAANACIDYALNATSCYGGTGGGVATLNSISIS
jgi:hypothetical protein